jgi:Fur family ferric uptake transcriptional regulator
MNDLQIAQILQRKGLKKTKLRLALIRHFINIPYALSYSDLKAAMVDATDKSTVYRNLAAFEAAGLIHSINDHSGTTKYAFGKLPTQGNGHAHFVCECCDTVYCMGQSEPLQLEIPKGFKANNVQTIIKGVCANC